MRVIAAKEFRDRIRNRWVLAVALIFALFALAIAYFGAAQQGAVGFRGIDVTIASLVSLVIYLVPLIALILGYDAIVGERERGSLELLLSMPITRFEILLGKYLGLAAALASSTVIGFGAGLLPLAAAAELRDVLSLCRLRAQRRADGPGLPEHVAAGVGDRPGPHARQRRGDRAVVLLRADVRPAADGRTGGQPGQPRQRRVCRAC